jgi:hypothetical protein
LPEPMTTGILDFVPCSAHLAEVVKLPAAEDPTAYSLVSAREVDQPFEEMFRYWPGVALAALKPEPWSRHSPWHQRPMNPTQATTWAQTVVPSGGMTSQDCRKLTMKSRFLSPESLACDQVPRVSDPLHRGCFQCCSRRIGPWIRSECLPQKQGALPSQLH